MPRPPLVLLPYVSGVSEDIRRVCRGFGLRVIFRSVLTKVNDTLLAEKQSRAVYQIPCSCGKTYVDWRGDQEAGGDKDE